MDLRQLDDIIPKRWVLLLYYYLPFLKKPASFYLKCRQLINELKRISPNHSFPLSRLPDLLLILDTYSKNNADLIYVGQKIIRMIRTEQYQQIDHLLLSNILFKFDPEHNEAIVLNELLKKIPDKVYKNLILLLIISQNKELWLIKWCARLANRFILADRLELILSLPDPLVSSQVDLLHALAFTELEIAINAGDGIAKQLTNSKNRVEFILKWQKNLKFSPLFLLMLFNRWLEAENPLFLAYIQGLNINARFIFFKELLAAPNNSPKSNETFLRHCPQLQRSLFINQLIEYFFSVFAPEAKESAMLTAKPFTEDDPRLLLLDYLLQNTTDYSLNQFQFFALSSLTRKPLVLEKLKKNSLEEPLLLEFAQNFPIELQKYVAEIYISAISDRIINTIIECSPEKSERYSVHYRLGLIREAYGSNTNQDPVAVLTQIIKEIQMNLSLELKQQCQILLTLLKQFYLLLENPAIQKLIQQSLITTEKMRGDTMQRLEGSHKLLQRITDGRQSRISIQRMKELYGEEAEAIQKKWTQQHLLTFFDGHNETERNMARREARAATEINHQFRAQYPYPTL